MSNPGDSGEITEQTRVPLKLAGSVLAALLSLGVAGLGAHSYWTGRISGLEQDAERAQQERDAATSERAKLAVKLAEVSEQLDTVEDAIRDLGAQLDRRLERIEDLSGDRWSFTDMRLWAERLGKHNPTLTVPPPESVRRPR